MFSQRTRYEGGTPEQRFWARAAHVSSLAARCLLALVIAFMGVSTYVFSQLSSPTSALASGSGDGEEVEIPSVDSIELRAFPIDGDENWIVPKGGKSTTTIGTNGGKLRLCVVGIWDGSEVMEAEVDDWEAKGAFSSGFDYKWSGEKVDVSPTGVVTALKDGETKITVVPKGDAYEGLSASITITTANQGEGLIVQKIEIVKESGKAYGDDNIHMTKPNETTKLYIRVTYKDKSDDNKKVVYSNYPGAPAGEKPAEGAFDTVAWGVGDDNYAVITNHNGVGTLKALASANTSVRVSITGGDVTKEGKMGPGVVYDVVGLNISNGKTVSNGDPAQRLKVNVRYSKDEKKKVVKTKTYSPSQFEKLGAVTKSYTLIQKRGKYVTDRAYGVPIATLLKDMGIDAGDVNYFTLAANDGANPGKISSDWLLKTTRYYLPNYDIGGSLQEKEPVPAMLALEDSWNVDTMITGEMNGGTRFRLVFGTGITSDGQLNCATDKAIKFINTFNIFLNGAAPVEENTKKDKDEKEQPSNAAKKQKADEKRKDKEQPKEEQKDKGSGGGKGGGTHGGSGKHDDQGEGKDKSNATTGVGGYSGGSSGGSDDTGRTDVVDLSKATKVDPQTSWRIYQMMNKTNSDISQVFEDNPLAPYVLPAFALILALAVFSRYARYRMSVS